MTSPTNSLAEADVHSTRRDPLLEPLKIRHLTLRNRIMSTSHACGLEEGGMPAERYQRYHEEKAAGGISLSMFGGSSNVAPDSPSVFQQLYVGDDRIIPYFQQFSQRMHSQGAALMCQITHLGRRGEPYAGNWLPTIGPSPIRETLHRSFPKEMDDHDIARVVKAFGAAARRCKEGGLDGLETLAAGHLIGQFMSPAMNKRTDRFGGSLENRMRFPILVHQEIRRQTGDDFIVGMRLTVEEGGEGWLSLDDCIAAAQLLQAEAGIDFFNATYGRADTERGQARDSMPGMDSPIAPWVTQVGAFKREVGLPVFHAARVLDVASARYAIRQGLLDMVGMTRAHIADPHLVRKLAAGQEDRIRPCIGATHCMSGYRPACLHNAATGREAKLPHHAAQAEAPGRRVVIIGGGPAGLEAARISAERGHHVVLFEAARELGGQILLGAKGSWRKDLLGIVQWREAELERLGVEVRLNRYVEPDEVRAENPDVVIIATGGMPDLGWLPGAELCTSVWDILTKDVALRDNSIIYDGTGRHPALLCAEMAGDQDKATTLVSLDVQMGQDLVYGERFGWKRRMHQLHTPMLMEHHLRRVQRAGNELEAVFVNEVTLEEKVLRASQVIVECGTLPLDGLYRDLRSASVNDGVTDLDALIASAPQPIRAGKGQFELYRVGDAIASRNIHAAILDSLRLCATL
ncbi:oxidoreductase [Albidovulum sediminis]|uniref:FAD-dependent oxidoreductase n=1 Tax=Albidovulum sediminis TaxID=3066345 RepID=A0ABT2NVG8_9RHOB|nr:FAD-dependent oxidoreductase [Defluviimonas sediminis]MCT8331594.1 FAD-dependent oxidoreductase [Defluviimonas sediminis]